MIDLLPADLLHLLLFPIHLCTKVPMLLPTVPHDQMPQGADGVPQALLPTAIKAEWFSCDYNVTEAHSHQDCSSARLLPHQGRSLLWTREGGGASAARLVHRTVPERKWILFVAVVGVMHSLSRVLSAIFGPPLPCRGKLQVRAAMRQEQPIAEVVHGTLLGSVFCLTFLFGLTASYRLWDGEEYRYRRLPIPSAIYGMLLPAFNLLEQVFDFASAPLTAPHPRRAFSGRGDSEDKSDVVVYKGIFVLATSFLSLLLGHTLAISSFSLSHMLTRLANVAVVLLLLSLLSLLAHRGIQVQAFVDSL